MKKLECEIKVNTNGTEYVGLEIKNDKITVCLPIGYDYKNIKSNPEELSDDLKKDIKAVMMLIAKKNKISGKKEDNLIDLDFITAVNVVSDYNNYGLYKQTELTRRNNFKGRINWQRTIHQNQTYVDNKVIYTNVVNEYINYKSEREIQEIQEICLYKIAKSIGVLLGFSYHKVVNTFNKLEMKYIIESELKKTNEDIKTTMLNNLLTFIQCTNFEAIEKENISIKYKEFQYIFQNLVDTGGITGSLKKEYQPKAKYIYFDSLGEINKRINPSEPDTIFIDDENKIIYILDAKYYEINNLPNEYDIFKQTRYAQYIREINKNDETKQKYKGYKILNAFVLPNNVEEIVRIKDYFAYSTDGQKEHKLENVIYVIYVDTKQMVNNPITASRCIRNELLKFSNLKEKDLKKVINYERSYFA